MPFRLVCISEDGDSFFPPIRWYLSESLQGMTTQKINVDINFKF
jgi:hypothetical protein